MGERHSCLLTSRGRVFCWGLAMDGILGDGQDTHQEKCLLDGTQVDYASAPVEVIDLPEATQISAGVYTTCAVHAQRPAFQGNVSCWGWHPDGVTTTSPVGVAFERAPMEDALQVTVGGKHGCVRREGKLPVCFGEYAEGERGNGRTDYVGEVVLASTLDALVSPEDIVWITAGDRHTCALLTSRELLCWGSNSLGQAGQPFTMSPILTPAEVPSFADIESVLGSGARTCAIKDNGETWCFGDGTSGQLGIGASGTVACNEFATSCTDVPRQVLTEQAGGGEAVQLAGGYSFGCVRFLDGRVACWGLANFGQLGPELAPGTSSRDTPILAIDGDVVDVAAGDNHACAILENGDVVCWGLNDCGQLGHSPSEYATSETPLKVPLRLD
jgi:alpha-tubulin suppressor-like RCC1 family protein